MILASLALQVCKFETDLEHQIVNMKPPNVCALSKVKTELMVHATFTCITKRWSPFRN
jgi:hypothetical protein